jgi:sodium-dependent dicarboxylate transporter 2/3/5
MMAVLCLSVTFLTEVTSNTATTTLLMPVLAAAAMAAGIDPAMLMIPAALSASCAFMLPVATAPNAIVFGTDRVQIAEMSRAGLALNILGAAALTGLCAALL